MPDIRQFGVKMDPNKDYRWSRRDSVDKNKYEKGFEPVKSDKHSDGLLHYREMVLMERPKELAVKEQKERETKARRHQAAARESLREGVEGLSSKHGRNLHKYVTDEED